MGRHMARPRRVAIIDRHPEFYLDALQRRFANIEFRTFDPTAGEHEAFEAWSPSAAFTVRRGTDPVGLFQAAVGCRSLEWLHVGGAGYEHLGAWDEKRLVVTNSAGLLAPFQAETVIGAILALNLNFPTYFVQKNKREWKELGFTPLAGKSLLVVGLGQIGTCVAELAAKLGMSVDAVTRTPKPHPALRQILPADGLSSALPSADFVSIHVPSNERTRHLMGAREFSLMKQGAGFINTARGAVVDQAALVGALRSGDLGGAYLDVFEDEPLPANDPLWALDNVIITPHVADSVSDWPNRFGNLFSENLERWLSGELLLNVIAK